MQLDEPTVARGKEPAQTQNQRKQARGEGPRPSSITGRRRGAGVVVISLAVLSLAMAGLWRAHGRHKKTVRPEKASAVLHIPDRVTTASSAAAPFQKLEGKWLRHDGGYVLQIQNVASNGKMDAAYFNP